MDERIQSQRRIAAEATLLKFEEELETLRALLSQSIKVKLEVARAEREGIEEKLRGKTGSKSLKASGSVKRRIQNTCVGPTRVSTGEMSWVPMLSTSACASH